MHSRFEVCENIDKTRASTFSLAKGSIAQTGDGSRFHLPAIRLRQHRTCALCTEYSLGVLWFATVRLAGSDLPHEGRLEVYYNDQWGTVCDDSFDDVDATVACKSLGAG